MCVRERTLLNDVGISGEESAFSNADNMMCVRERTLPMMNAFMRFLARSRRSLTPTRMHGIGGR